MDFLPTGAEPSNGIPNYLIYTHTLGAHLSNHQQRGNNSLGQRMRIPKKNKNAPSGAN